MKTYLKKLFLASIGLSLFLPLSFCQDTLSLVILEVDSTKENYLFIGRELTSNTPYIAVIEKEKVDGSYFIELAQRDVLSLFGTSLNVNPRGSRNSNNSLFIYEGKSYFSRGESVIIFFIETF